MKLDIALYLNLFEGEDPKEVMSAIEDLLKKNNYDLEDIEITYSDIDYESEENV